MPSDKHFEDVIYPSESDLNSSKDESCNSAENIPNLENFRFSCEKSKFFDLY